ncbi:hypothetical protein [uncultured Rikenella sp.]|uniref:hypothetical protein n=1 Tax=uncultured Rikenella sp. TaxID=368003 RepID=UPI0025F16E7F|nr:hypothetical protein [uncultured Rikenella sp.]
MKRQIQWALTLIMAVSSYTCPVFAQDFDAKLKRFITLDNGKYIPEISCDEAIRLGFTVHDYHRFTDYVDRINIQKTPALNAPENLFLCSFIEFDGNKAVLTIPLEKALRAGATAEGYLQTLESLNAINAANLSDNDKEKLIRLLRDTRQKMLDFARQHPDNCAVKKYFTPPTLDETDF